MVNVDQYEMEKARPIPNIAIAADVGEFMEAILTLPDPKWGDRLHPWLQACRHWRTYYLPISDDYFSDTKHVNSYIFMDVLSNLLNDGDTILTGNSLDAWSLYQAFKVQDGQRIFTNINFGSMGWDIPGAIGACVAQKGHRTILVTGDGSFQFNIQELQTIQHNRLCVKIFVFNNLGYASIRSTQQTHFNGHIVGADASSGVSCPSFRSIAESYEMRYEFIHNNEELETIIQTTLKGRDAVLCEVNIAYEQARTPRVISHRRQDGTMESGTMENMYPFLPSEEVWRNMHMFDDNS